MDQIIDLASDTGSDSPRNEEIQEPLIVYNDVSSGVDRVHHEEVVETTSATAAAASSADTSSLEDDNVNVSFFGRNLALKSFFFFSQVCSICFESYTTTGPHRMSCLKCGHLFGKR